MRFVLLILAFTILVAGCSKEDSSPRGPGDVSYESEELTEVEYVSAMLAIMRSAPTPDSTLIVTENFGDPSVARTLRLQGTEVTLSRTKAAALNPPDELEGLHQLVLDTFSICAEAFGLTATFMEGDLDYGERGAAAFDRCGEGWGRASDLIRVQYGIE